MRNHRYTARRGGHRAVVWVFVLFSALFLTNCTERLTDPIGPQTEQKSTLGKTAVNGQLFESNNFYSVPLDGWPGTNITWGGDLVVYAHGYYAPADLPWTPGSDKVDGTPISGIVNSLGFAYASTSYRSQGLVVPEAVEDIVILVNGFTAKNNGRKPTHVYLVGPSEGGVVTTLAIEKYPGVFSGGMAMCGPIGDFRKQMDYLGDFHLLFSYFFPAVVPGDPRGIPDVGNPPAPITLDEWNNTYRPSIEYAVANNASPTRQLLSVSRASIDLGDPTSVPKTVVDILWYNLFATNDAITRLNGFPFNNKSPYRWYFGSNNDLRLNLTIPRLSATPAAVARMNNEFQTSGRLGLPLVTLHTTGDPIIPYWHATQYLAKTILSGSGLRHTHIPILRYGHCNFKVYEVLAGFAVLVLKVTARDLIVTTKALPSIEEQNQLRELAGKHGARPKLPREIAQIQR